MTNDSISTPLAVICRHFSPQIAALLTPAQRAETVRIFRLIADKEREPIARAWMIGMNPQLGDENPILAIRNGQAREVEVAARAYVNGV